MLSTASCPENRSCAKSMQTVIRTRRVLLDKGATSCERESAEF